MSRPLALALLANGTIALWFVLSRTAGTAAAADGFPLDDAWIHMVYGRNFAADFVPAYNDTAEAGFTSPLWMLALAVAHWCSAVLPFGPVFFVKSFGVVCASVTTAAIYHLGVRLTQSRPVGVLAATLCVLCPTLAFAQVSGMEVSLTTAACSLAMLALADGRFWRCGVLLGLAYWSRPECALLALLAPIVPIAVQSEPARVRAGRAVAIATPPLVAAALWALYCLCATGHPLPNTFHAKFDLTGQGNLLASMIEVLRRLPSNWLAAGIALVAVALVRAHRTAQPRLTALLAIYPFVFLFAIVRTRPCPDNTGEFFFFARYPAPAWPFLLLATAVGAHALWRLGADQDRPRWRHAARAIAAVLVLCTLVNHPSTLSRSVERFSWNCQNINEVQVAFGHWVAANVSAGRAVAVNDAGAIRYFGNRHTVDLMGLNDQEVLFSPEVANARGDVDAAADYLLARRVDFAIVFPMWFQHLVRHPRFAARFTPGQTLRSDHYTVADPRSGQTSMVAYRVLTGAAPRPPR